VITPTANNVTYGNTRDFGVPMRGTPTVLIYGYAGGSGKVSVATVDQAANSGGATDTGENGFTAYNGSGGNVVGAEIQYHYLATAEL
jgi:hypothetical protein